MSTVRQWFAGGTPWIWLQAAAVSLSLLLVIGLLGLIAARGLAHFWPGPVEEWVVINDRGEQQVVFGQLHRTESVDAQRLREAGVQIDTDISMVQRYLLKIGNRDLTGQDFIWVLDQQVVERTRPANVLVVEREQWGMFYGRLTGLREDGSLVSLGMEPWTLLQERLDRVNRLRDRIDELEGQEINSVNYRLEKLDLRAKSLEGKPGAKRALEKLASEREVLEAEFNAAAGELEVLFRQIGRDSMLMRTADGQETEIPMEVVLDAWRPNQMGLTRAIGHYGHKLWSFLSEPPREANTEGGVLPALFGTVLMVVLMSIFVTPLGVVAAVYLSEYASQGWFTRFMRISVNNLAGVPSIVYGVFGLGFFIYFVGGGIDKLFFSEALPTPTFGTGGLFWASLTLALLTLPVVIVSTEEGLSRIPRAIREGSLALGATRWETLWRTILPMASPGIMTGVILAVARAAGEVAPLMLVGVVKLAPALPLDGDFPFLHLDRKFMHLGFHIYDVGFQSPNVEAARPLVYATALLLVAITLLLNLTAISIRNRLREQYRDLEAQ